MKVELTIEQAEFIQGSMASAKEQFVGMIYSDKVVSSEVPKMLSMAQKFARIESIMGNVILFKS